MAASTQRVSFPEVALPFVSNHGSSRPITTSRAQMMIGYSRHSCSLKHQPNEAYLLDHSQFGHGHSSIHLDVARVGGG
jgi:hypothetical protein